MSTRKFQHSAREAKPLVNMLKDRGLSHQHIAERAGLSLHAIDNIVNYEPEHGIKPSTMVKLHKAVESMMGEPRAVQPPVQEPLPFDTVPTTGSEKATLWVEKVPAPFVGLVFGIALALVLSWASK